MAMNLLPLLLVGSAAAYVVTSEKKKKEEKECPPTTTISFGEMQSSMTRAGGKFGKDPDPSQEASFFVKELLPRGCSRASKDSVFKIDIPDVKGSWELTVPDAYMLTFMTSLGARVGTKKLSKEKAEEYWARELDWYKGVMGKNFDIGALKLEDLAGHIADAVKGALAQLGMTGDDGDLPSNSDMPGDDGDLPSNSDMPGDGTCPPVYDYIYDEQEDAKMKAAFDQGRQLHPNDPFKIADVIFAATAPPGCTKRDFNTKVLMTMKPPGSSSEYEPIVLEMDMASMYAMLVVEAANKMGLSPAQKSVIQSKVADNYQALTGKPLSV